jgi:hypothetical protein
VIAEDAHIEQLIARGPDILLMGDRIIPLNLVEDVRDMEIHLKIDSDHFYSAGWYWSFIKEDKE